ncbi:hypothetical protein H8E65_09525 [Candidatus Bathyarchaeota archaeon]|nr:hypothetical protein [Candidatus Bathyarchaeota archaeon]MBL7080150.1 hypothetical protein [Candidatus Bathyarchaeota archaeon]
MLSITLLITIGSTCLTFAQDIPNYDTGQYEETDVAVANYSFSSQRFASNELSDMEIFITSQVVLFAITPVSDGFLHLSIPDGKWSEVGTGGSPISLMYVTKSMEDAFDWLEVEAYYRSAYQSGYLGVPVVALETILFGVGPGWEYENDLMEHINVLDDSGTVNYSWVPSTGGGAQSSLKITGVDAPSSVNAGEDFVVTVSIEYSLPAESHISIDIVDPSASTRVASNEYTVGGTNSGSSEFTLTAPGSSGTIQLGAQVWLFENDSWVHDESGWYAPISIDVKKSIPGFPMLSILLGATAGLLILWLNKR